MPLTLEYARRLVSIRYAIGVAQRQAEQPLNTELALLTAHDAVFGSRAQTLRVTLAMESGIASHVWSIEEIVGLLDAVEKKAA